MDYAEPLTSINIHLKSVAQAFRDKKDEAAIYELMQIIRLSVDLLEIAEGK